MSKIGILDLQGGVVEHLGHLERLGVAAVRAKTASDLAGLAGLIIPGGESTCLTRLLHLFGLDDAIRARFGQGMKVWGTCAGAIVVATQVVGEGRKLGLIDITVRRNAFGSQLDSFQSVARIPAVADTELPLTFIRSPKILAAGPGVEVLLRQDDYIAMAETPGVLVTVFHPELTPCLAFHRYFVHKCGIPTTNGQDLITDPKWTMTSWTRLAPIQHPS
jgi:5'-phosphate synthase pdxT subunit